MTKRIAAAALLAAAAVSLSGPAFAAGHVRHLQPPVSVERCEEGGGWVAVDIASRTMFCTDGVYKDRVVT